MNLLEQTPEEKELLQFAELASTEEGRQKLLIGLVPAEHMPADPEGLARLHEALVTVATMAVNGAKQIAQMRAAALGH